MNSSKKSLSQFKSTMLVSCPGTAGGLVYLAGDLPFVISMDPCTGIYLDNESLMVAHQHDGGRSILSISRDETKIVSLSENPLDLHDILLRNDSLFAVATENNEVVECDAESYLPINRWGLPGEHDSSHMNSLTFYQGKLLVSVFGMFERHRQYKEESRGLGQVVDIVSGEVFIEGLSQPHSLTVVGDLLYMCNSEAKEIRIYEGNKLQAKVAMPGYTRGLAVTEHEIYVGISLSRNVIRENEDATAFVLVLNRESLAISHKIAVPFSEIYDIRLIDEGSDLVLRAVNIESAENLIMENNRLMEAYEQTKEAYEQTKEAYEQTKEAYESIKIPKWILRKLTK